MEGYVSERRNSRLSSLQNQTTSPRLEIRLERTESGIGKSLGKSPFATDAPLIIGSAVEVLLKMPEEISGRPTTEWRRTGHESASRACRYAAGQVGCGHTVRLP